MPFIPCATGPTKRKRSTSRTERSASPALSTARRELALDSHKQAATRSAPAYRSCVTKSKEAEQGGRGKASTT
eukprot:84734-Chlamydomonas_euryale.AAC.2